MRLALGWSQVDSRLINNFNNLMYEDDLILITKASRSVVRNIKFFLSVHSKLTGQNPNSSKSTVYFPSWFNKRLVSWMSNVLSFNVWSFPFTYLGITISPRKLSIQNFGSIVSKVQIIISLWKHFHILHAGRVVLIKSVLMSIPSYTLAVYEIPDTSLVQIAKFARSFLWFKGNNRSGFSRISWKRATLEKSDGRLAIGNLRNLKKCFSY